MIEKAARSLHAGRCCEDEPTREDRSDAEWVVDAILPQVTTVEELEALPDRSIVVDALDRVWTSTGDGEPFLDCRYDAERTLPELAARGPLTVVWQP